MKILLVENIQEDMNLLNRIITQAGYDTIQAGGMIDAIKKLEQTAAIGVIISSLKISGKDSFEFLGLLKADVRFKDIPVLICSDQGDSEIVARAVGLGVRDVILKPVSRESLLPKVCGLIEKFARTVLVVDDEETIRELLSSVLERQGYVVFKAEGGEVALDILQRNRIDVVITDIVMPSMDGLELCARIKDKHNKTKVLLISGNADRSILANGAAARADGFISKPFKNIDIIERLDSLQPQ